MKVKYHMLKYLAKPVFMRKLIISGIYIREKVDMVSSNSIKKKREFQ